MEDAIRQLAEATKAQALATVFAAVYAASEGHPGRISKALDAVERFKRSL